MVPVLARAMERRTKWYPFQKEQWKGQNGTRSSKSNGKENKMVPVLARAMERRTKWYPFQQEQQNENTMVPILARAMERRAKWYPFQQEQWKGEQNGTRSSKSNGKDPEFEYNLLMICRHLNLLKNQRKIFITNRKFKVVTTLKF